MDVPQMSITMKRQMNTGWIDVQRRTFTNWVNVALKVRGLKCEVLTDDFDDGVLLCNLYEILIGEPLPLKYNKKPRVTPQKLENLSIALDSFKEEGLKIINIGSKDVMDGDDKLLLGLIWSLILRYQISGSGNEKAARSALLEWVQKQIASYPVQKVVNFKNSWADGRAINALVDSLSPGLSHPDKCTGNVLNDIVAAMCRAEDNFAIPMVLAPSDMEAAEDELSCMTYISYFKDYAEKHGVVEFVGVDPTKCTAEGEGLAIAVDNQPAFFTVGCRTSAGDLIGKGGDDVVVRVHNVNNDQCDVEVKDYSDGNYGVSYAADAPGEYQIEVLVNGKHIPGSTFHVTIYEGIQPELATGTFTFTLQSKSKSGNDLTRGGGDWKVNVKGPNDSEIDVKTIDNDDGTYSATYELTAVDDSDAVFEVTCKLDGVNVASSPFKHRLGPKPSPFEAAKNILKKIIQPEADVRPEDQCGYCGATKVKGRPFCMKCGKKHK